MKKFLKWFGIVIGVIILIAAIAVFFIIGNLEKRSEKKYEITPLAITVPADSASLARGAEIGIICTGCHESDFGGKMMFEDPSMGSVYSPNLTSGKGGIGATYTDADWVRSIRHGVNPAGRPLLIMPSKDYHHLGQKDLECLIAYIKGLPPVDRENGKTELKMLAKIIAGVGGFGDMYSAEILDHKAKFEDAPPPSESAIFGDYMVKISGCRSCHLDNLGGGKSPEPNAPPVPDISSGGNIGKWSAEEFIQAMRSGITPEGKKLDPIYMPYKEIGKLPEVHLKAIHAYLLSTPKAKAS